MKNFVLIMMLSAVFSNNQYPSENQINAMIKESMQLIWEAAMESKETINHITPNVREELLSNLCASAPNTSFHTHCDLSDSLAAVSSDATARVFVSDDSQVSWTENSSVDIIGIPVSYTHLTLPTKRIV